MRRASARCLLATTVGGALSLGALLACGSRTGIDLLVIPLADETPDAGAVTDVGAEAAVDAGFDVGFDAGVESGDDAETDAPFFDAIRPFDARISPDAGLTCTNGTAPTAYLFNQGGGLYTFDPTTLATQLLGTPDCPTGSTPWTLSVSRAGFAYLVYEDWAIYKVDLANLACERTPFPENGAGPEFALAVSRTAGIESLFLYGEPGDATSPVLAQADLVTFIPTTIGPIAPLPTSGGYPVDMQADLLNHLFVYDTDSNVYEVDPASGDVIGLDMTGFSDFESWAIMTFGEEIYLFSGAQVARYDLGTHHLSVLGTLDGVTVVGASAVPCVQAE